MIIIKENIKNDRYRSEKKSNNGRPRDNHYREREREREREDKERERDRKQKFYEPDNEKKYRREVKRSRYS